MQIENLEDAIVGQTHSFERKLNDLCSKLNYDYACYSHVNSVLGIISGFSTYPYHWVYLYKLHNLHEKDPIVICGPQLTTPTDWVVFKEDPRFQCFFEHSERSGIGKNGITIPVKSACGEPGTLSVTKDCDPRVWKGLLTRTLFELRQEAGIIHNMALTLTPVECHPLH